MCIVFAVVGTVETFERKLEDAQRSLGIAPRDFIPVIYVNETSWSSEIMKYIPTALVIGKLSFVIAIPKSFCADDVEM